MLSYQSVITRFQEFADAHYLIESYGTGEAWQIIEHNKLKNRKYPMMWVEDMPFPTSGTTGNAGVTTYTFRVYFLSQVATLKNKTASTLEQTNVVEVKSDMLQCAQDLTAYWVQDHVYDELDFDKNTLATPFHDITNDNLAGFYIDIKLEQAFKYNSCAVPMAGVTPPPSGTCPDATVTINGVSYGTVSSGATENINVHNTSGADAGSLSGGDWIIGDVSWTDSDSSPQTTPYGDAIVCTPASPVINSSSLYRTGQTSSYRTGDDGATQRGNGASWTVLSHNNGFGNTNRFTDTLGTQSYANDVVIVWSTWDVVNSTVLGFYRVVGTGTTWDQAIDAAVALTTAGYSDWTLPNLNELNHISDKGTDPMLNYAPFNINTAAQPDRLWTGTTNEDVNTRAYCLIENGNFQALNKTSTNQSWIAVREYTLTELGL